MGSGDGLENFELGAEIGFGRLVDGIGAGRPLHFADVDDAVGPVEEKVNLGATRVDIIGNVTPGGHANKNASNLEGAFDLWDVGEANTFKCEAGPCILCARALRMSPETVIVGWSG